MPTTGMFNGFRPIEPAKRAVPAVNTPPSDATAQNPLPSGADATPTSGAFICGIWSDAPPDAAPNPVTKPAQGSPAPAGPAPNAKLNENATIARSRYRDRRAPSFTA